MLSPFCLKLLNSDYEVSLRTNYLDINYGTHRIGIGSGILPLSGSAQLYKLALCISGSSGKTVDCGSGHRKDIASFKEIYSLRFAVSLINKVSQVINQNTTVLLEFYGCDETYGLYSVARGRSLGFEYLSIKKRISDMYNITVFDIGSKCIQRNY